MESLWEIGCIHRGAKWETINLKAYSTANPTSSTIGAYADGDANILDQLKLNDNWCNYGKININSSYTNTFIATFLNKVISVTANANPSSTSTSLTYANALNYAYAIKNCNGAVAGGPFTARGQLARVSGLQSGSTDFAKEYLIGKLADYGSIENNYFRIISISQAIKDVGTATTSSGKAVTAGNGIKLSYVDASGTVQSNDDCRYGVYEANTDKILSEQKIMAVFQRNVYTNIWKLLSYEYLDK